MPAMLLNELQRQQRLIEAQQLETGHVAVAGVAHR
jgi:hypothetical protein